MEIKEKAKHPYNTQKNITLDYFIEQAGKRTKHEQDFTFLIDAILSDSKLIKGTGHNLPLYYDASKPIEDFLKAYYDELKKGQELNKLDETINKVFGDSETTNYKYGIIYYYDTIQESTEDKINIIINKLKNNEDITPKKCIIDLEKMRIDETITNNDLSFFDYELIGIGSSEKIYYRDFINPKLNKYFTRGGIKEIRSYYNKIPKVKPGRTNQQEITFKYIFNNRELLYNHDEIKTFNELLEFKIKQYQEENIKLQEELKEYNINIVNKTYNVLNDIAIQFYNRTIEELIPLNRLLQAYEPITEEQSQLKELVNNKANYNEIQAIITENNKAIEELKQEQQSPLNSLIDDDFKRLITPQFFNRNQKNYIEKVEQQNQLQQVNDNTLIENIIFGNVYLEELKNNEIIEDYKRRKAQNELNNSYLQEDKKKLEQLKKQSRFSARQTSIFGDEEPLNDEIEKLINSINDLENIINKDEKMLKQTIVIYEGDKARPTPKYYKPIYSLNNLSIESIEDDTKRDAIKIVMLEGVKTNEPNINVIKYIPKKIILNDKIIYANEYLTSKLLTKLSAFTSALLRKASNGNDKIIFDIKELEHITGIEDQKNNALRKTINIICETLRKTDLEEMQLIICNNKTRTIEKLEDPKATIISAYSWIKKQLIIEIPSYLKQSKAIISSYYEQSKELILNKPEIELLHRYIASLMNNEKIKGNGEIKNQTHYVLNLISKAIPSYFLISDRTKREISLIIEPIINLFDDINNNTNYGIINWNKAKKELENITNYDAFSKYKIELYIKNPHPKTDYKRLKIATSYNDNKQKLNDELRKAKK